MCLMVIQASGVGSVLFLCWREQPLGPAGENREREIEGPCGRGHGAIRKCPQSATMIAPAPLTPECPKGDSQATSSFPVWQRRGGLGGIVDSAMSLVRTTPVNGSPVLGWDESSRVWPLVFPSQGDHPQQPCALSSGSFPVLINITEN